MKKTLFCLAVLCCMIFSSCDIHINTGNDYNGDGVSVTRGNNPNVETADVEFVLAAFKEIDASSIFDIQVVKSDVQSVKVTIDKNLAQALDVKVKDGVLKLKIRKGKYTINTLKATVSMPDLQSVELSGGCKLYSNDLFNPTNFEAELSGASSLDLKLRTASAKFDLSGACNTKIFAEGQNLKIGTSGSSDIQISGEVENVKISSSGSSNINTLNLKALNVDIESSGSSNISVHAEKKLSVDASGASNIRYLGQPVLSVDASGSSSVKPQ